MELIEVDNETVSKYNNLRSPDGSFQICFIKLKDGRMVVPIEVAEVFTEIPIKVHEKKEFSKDDFREKELDDVVLKKDIKIEQTKDIKASEIITEDKLIEDSIK